LFIASIDAVDADPVKGTFNNSSKDCIFPSSPFLPCRQIKAAS